MISPEALREISYDQAKLGNVCMNLMDRNSRLEWENQRLRHWLLFWQGIGAAGIGWFVADMVWTVVS